MNKITHWGTPGALALALALALGVTLFAEDRMRSGLWEVTTSVSARRGAPVAHTSTTCYTPEMVKLANSPATTLREATEKAASRRAGCSIKDFKLDKGTIAMTMVCDKSTIVTSSTYAGVAFETVNTVTEVGVVTESRMKGRLLGACK